MKLFAISLLLTSSLAADYGSQSMTAPLKQVLVKKPDTAFSEADPTTWHYTDKPDLENARREHDYLSKILLDEGVEVVYHEENLKGLADSIYVHDPVIITDKGALILRMGKELRRGEEDAIEKRLNALGIPTLYKMHGTATCEAGDTLWVDHDTLAVGDSYRTNPEGIRQLREALEPLGVEVIQVPLPHFEGPQACLHLQSLISLVDEKTALVYRPLTPVPFLRLLEERGFDIIDVPEEEFMTMGPNVLCIRPKVCLTLDGNPITRERLEAKGVKVHTYPGKDLSLKAEGGATCLTRPLWRAPS